MKEIKLTKGFSTLVDDEDYDYLMQWKWFARKSKNKYYASRSIRINKKQFMIQMARVIMNTPNGMEPDHYNHNTLDNQRSNLLNCTHQENCKNITDERRNKYSKEYSPACSRSGHFNF